MKLLTAVVFLLLISKVSLAYERCLCQYFPGNNSEKPPIIILYGIEGKGPEKWTKLADFSFPEYNGVTATSGCLNQLKVFNTDHPEPTCKAIENEVRD
jgi:hypothetical protein